MTDVETYARTVSTDPARQHPDVAIKEFGIPDTGQDHDFLHRAVGVANVIAGFMTSGGYEVDEADPRHLVPTRTTIDAWDDGRPKNQTIGLPIIIVPEIATGRTPGRQEEALAFAAECLRHVRDDLTTAAEDRKVERALSMRPLLRAIAGGHVLSPTMPQWKGIVTMPVPGRPATVRSIDVDGDDETDPWDCDEQGHRLPMRMRLLVRRSHTSSRCSWSLTRRIVAFRIHDLPDMVETLRILGEEPGR